MSLINLVLVSDTHLPAQANSKLSKINTLDTLNKVLESIQYYALEGNLGLR